MIEQGRFIGHHGRMPASLHEVPVVAAKPCCEPLAAAPLAAVQATELARRLKALADPARLRVLSLLLADGGREACTCDLVEPLGLRQPTVTHHLQRLAAVGLVRGERRGRWTYYRAVPEALDSLRSVLRVR